MIHKLKWVQPNVEHFNLPVGPVNFDCVAGVPIHCKVDCFSKFSPCTFEFDYRNEAVLNVYASLSDQAPDSENCDVYAVGRPTHLKISNEPAHSFDKKSLYLTISSDQNCQVTVNTSFCLVDPLIKINEAIKFGKEKRKTKFDLEDLQLKLNHDRKKKNMTIVEKNKDPNIQFLRKQLYAGKESYR